MKKFILLGLTGLLGVGMAMAQPARSVREAQQLVKEGKVRKMPQMLPTRSNQGLKSLPGVMRNGESETSRLTSFKGANRLPALQPNRLTEKGATIYGYLSWDDSDRGPGMYEFTEDGFSLLWADPLVDTDYMIQADQGWYEDGKITGVVIDSFWGYVFGYYGYSIDFNSGQLLSMTEYDVANTDVLFATTFLNTDNGLVYGYAQNYLDGGNIYWAYADPTDITNATPVKYAGNDFCYSLCYNPVDGQFYGININQEFVVMDEEGNQTFIADVPDASDMATYLTGLVWSPVANAFYWNAYYSDDTSALFTITPDGTFEAVDFYPTGPEFTYMFTTDEGSLDPDQPLRPEIGSINFDGGSLTGSITFSIPSELIGGDVIPAGSQVEWTALLDKETYKTGTATPGSDVTVDFTVEEAGYHAFAFYVTYNDLQSTSTSMKKWIGNDTPLAPAEVTLTPDMISWTSVGDEGIHGGYVNESEVTYYVYLNGTLVGSTKETSMAYDLPGDLPIRAYNASVYAEYAGLKSGFTSSNKLIMGEPYTVPYFIQPTEDEFGLMTIEDANQDGVTWRYTSEYDGAIQTTYTSTYSEFFDDYIFLPPVKITDTSSYYRFSLESVIKSRSYPEEYLEVVYASAPNSNSLMGVLINEFTPNAVRDEGAWDYTETLWKVPAAGTYYIGIHATSAGDQLGLLARAFTLTATAITEDSPAAPSIISAKAGENGALNATVEFRFPTEYLNGETIEPSSLMTGNVSVNGVPIDAAISGLPGEASTLTVTTEQGDNTIEIWVTLGELESPQASVTVFTGQSVPAIPENVIVKGAPDMMSAVVTWDAVTEAFDTDGFIIPEDVTYNVYQYVDFGFFTDWILISEGIKGTSATITLPEGSVQDYYRFGVASFNVAGTNGYVNSNYDYLGQPFELPMIENFDDPDEVFNYSPWMMVSKFNNVDYEGSWYLDNLNLIAPEFEDDTRVVIVGYPMAPGQEGMLQMPRFSTKDVETATLSITVMTGPDTANGTIYAEIYGSDELIEIGSYEGTNGGNTALTELTFDLPESLMGQYWVGIYFIAEYSSVDDLFVLAAASVTGNGSTAVENLETRSGIIGGKNSIAVIGLENENIAITTLDGKTIVTGKVNSNSATFRVEKGVYVVNTDSRKAKVIVR